MATTFIQRVGILIVILQMVSYGTSSPACDDNPIKPCLKAGTLCESCTSLVMCQPNDDDFVKIPVAECMDDEKCLVDRCTNDTNPICDGLACLPYPCTMNGLFPDPFFCTTYHACAIQSNQTIHEEFQCQTDFSYNANSTYCDIPLANPDDCEIPVPLCENPGASGALPADPSIYFICEQYNTTVQLVYPFLYSCPHGLVYDDYHCHDPHDTSTIDSLWTNFNL